MDNYSKKVKKILIRNKCHFERHGKGDHDIWYSPVSGKYFPVDSKIKSRHTAMQYLSRLDWGKNSKNCLCCLMYRPFSRRDPEAVKKGDRK